MGVCPTCVPCRVPTPQSTWRHSLECLQRGIHRVPRMAPDAVCDQLRIELARVVKTGRVNRYQLRHGLECQVDRRSTGEDKSVTFVFPLSPATRQFFASPAIVTSARWAKVR